MGDDSSSDVAASQLEDQDPSVTAVADEPAVTRDRAPEIKPGDVLAGRYQIEAVIGKGGSGVVLRAYDRVSATVVAVKVLKPALSHDPRWEKRFQRELRLGRPIRHPNVCRIFDIADDADGYRFLTMEYATGGTLRDLIKTNQPLRPLAERLADAAGVIAGLAAIHAAGIVHRDVKPDNVLRMDDGRLVLSDFGLATDLPESTMVSVFVGTPHYMAPEVREGDPATTRSDVWSLGVVLHEVFFGKRPEKRSARSATSVSRSSTTSTSSTIERAMMALCARCLADDPAERPEDAPAVKELFERTRRSPGAVLWSRARRKLLYWSTGVAAIGVLGAVGLQGVRSHAPTGGVQVKRLVNTGEATDWTTSAKVVASVPGHVHCFSLIGADTVRLIWGSPRTATDVSLDTGVSRPASLVKEAYATGCPDLSPDGRELLFTANTAGGVAEIRRSATPDGKDATSVTAGWDPVWMGNGEEFAYTIDGAHAAVFSLATRKFHLLADPGVGSVQSILGKAVGARGQALALMFFGNDIQWAVAIYEGPELNQRASFAISGARNFRFAPTGDRLFVAPVESRSPLAVLDWKKNSYRNLGRYKTTDLVDVVISGQTAALLARRRSRDVWLYDKSSRRRLTTDGDNHAAAISPNGELLVAKAGYGSSVNIWSRPADGVLRKVTSGQFDTAPDFSPDGGSWTYVDYDRRNIMLCATGSGQCRVTRHDEILPTWPRFSPDGSKIAYVRFGASSQMVAFSLSDGKEWALGGTHWQCPPVWSSPTNIWTFEGSAGGYAWVEKEVATGLRTGRRVQVTDSQSAINDELECWPRDGSAGPPFFPKLRVETEETSSVLSLPTDRLGD